VRQQLRQRLMSCLSSSTTDMVYIPRTVFHHGTGISTHTVRKE
jgi:uncharacterized RmlC-like cupin family protein